VESFLSQQSNLRIRKKKKIKMNVGKRILFEILFALLLVPLMIYHMLLVYMLATWECFKIYPTEIYELTKRIMYGEKDS
jgi:hypothetical protein